MHPRTTEPGCNAPRDSTGADPFGASPPIVVLGIGNLLWADEGFGVRCVEALMERYEFGPDAGLAEGNFDFVVVADFDDEAAYGRYASHPAHVALIRDRIRPFISERVAVQYRLP